jgi:hypothetical protein
MWTNSCTFEHFTYDTDTTREGANHIFDYLSGEEEKKGVLKIPRAM